MSYRYHFLQAPIEFTEKLVRCKTTEEYNKLIFDTFPDAREQHELACDPEDPNKIPVGFEEIKFNEKFEFNTGTVDETLADIRQKCGNILSCIADNCNDDRFYIAVVDKNLLRQLIDDIRNIIRISYREMFDPKYHRYYKDYKIHEHNPERAEEILKMISEIQAGERELFIRNRANMWRAEFAAPYNLDDNNDMLAQQWEFEYVIWDLVRLYKSLDWTKYNLLITGW